MRLNNFKKTFSFCSLLLLLASCNSESHKTSNNALFQSLPSSQTGIDFVNSVKNTKDFNVFRYRNFYNGGGVAIGDINNDGAINGIDLAIGQAVILGNQPNFNNNTSFKL